MRNMHFEESSIWGTLRQVQNANSQAICDTVHGASTSGATRVWCISARIAAII